jgi:beta-aspartyl-peptidase (threonine type)
MNPDDVIDSDQPIFEWLLKRANGGDWVVLTADPDDDWDLYNAYLLKFGLLNSVTTIGFTSRDGSFQPEVAATLRGAAGIFFTGGDQRKYELWWRNSPVSSAIAELAAKGRSFGGESAGLAVLGQIVYTALEDSIDSSEALKNPFDPHLTLGRDLFHLPLATFVVTDTHFLQRDRMGRLVAFIARAFNSSWNGPQGILGLGISEHSAVLLDGTTGTASLAGPGPVYFLDTSSTHASDVVVPDMPLSFGPVPILRWAGTDAPASFDFRSWTGRGFSLSYSIGAKNGVLWSTQPGGSVY